MKPLAGRRGKGAGHVVFAAALALGAGCGSRTSAPAVVQVEAVQASPAEGGHLHGAGESVEPAMQIVTNGQRLCVRAAGRVFCADEVDPLDDRPLLREENALPDIRDARSLALGGGHLACVATKRQTVLCSAGDAHAIEIADLRGVRRVSAGSTHACALLEDGSVRCWAGALGRPLPVAGLTADEIACTSHTICAVTRAREVACFAVGEWHVAPDRAAPPDVEHLGVSDTARCGIHEGRVLCWQGKDWLPRTASPELPRMTAAHAVAVGDQHGCALVAGGEVMCFGAPISGALGRSFPSDDYGARSGLLVEGLPPAIDLTVARAMSCALTATGDAWCWGRWTLRDGTYDTAQPVRIRLR